MSSRNELFIVDDNVEVIKVSELTAKVAPHALAGTVCLSIASTLDFFPSKCHARSHITPYQYIPIESNPERTKAFKKTGFWHGPGKK